MERDDKGRSFVKGDRIRLLKPGLIIDTGTVLTAGWFRNDGWYVEIQWDHNLGYGYWKQDMDGGEIEHYTD